MCGREPLAHGWGRGAQIHIRGSRGAGAAGVAARRGPEASPGCRWSAESPPPPGSGLWPPRLPPFWRPRPFGDSAGRRRVFRRTVLSRVPSVAGCRARPAGATGGPVTGDPGSRRALPARAPAWRARGGGSGPGGPVRDGFRVAPERRLCSVSSPKPGEADSEPRGGGVPAFSPQGRQRSRAQEGATAASTTASRSFPASRSYFWKGHLNPPLGSPTSSTSGPRVAGCCSQLSCGICLRSAGGQPPSTLAAVIGSERDM